MLDLTDKKLLNIKLQISEKKFFKSKTKTININLQLPSQDFLEYLNRELNKEEKDIDKINLVKDILNNNVENIKITKEQVENINIFDAAKIITAYNQFIVDTLNQKN